MLRAITPLQVHIDPLFLKFIPTYTSRLAILSQTGRKVGIWVLWHQTVPLHMLAFQNHILPMPPSRSNHRVWELSYFGGKFALSAGRNHGPILLSPPLPPQSHLGQCQFCEPTGLANPADIFHVNTVGQLIMSFDVSASKQALVFGDSEGCVHLWADSPEITFNAYSRETDFALPCIVDTLPHLDWNQDLMPLSLIPVPLTTESLLSDWPSANSSPAPR